MRSMWERQEPTSRSTHAAFVHRSTGWGLLGLWHKSIAGQSGPAILLCHRPNSPHPVDRCTKAAWVLRDVGSCRSHIDRIERLARGHKQAVALRAAETDVGAIFRQ